MDTKALLLALSLCIAHPSFGSEPPPFYEIPDTPINTNLPTAQPIVYPLVPFFAAPSIPPSYLMDFTYSGFPPDPAGAVGLSHVMTMINFYKGVQLKAPGSSNILDAQSLPAFWNQGTNFSPIFSIFDPVVLYDPYADRYIAVAAADGRTTSASVLIGVSMTGNPRGAWNLRRQSSDSGGESWPDFPRVAFNDRWIVVSANMLRVNSGTGDQGSYIYVFDKTNLYAGNFSAPTIYHYSGSGTRGITPAVNYDNTSEMYLLRNATGNDGGSGYLEFGNISGTATNPTLNWVVKNVRVPRTWSNLTGDSAPQQGTTVKLELGDARFRPGSVLYKNGKI